MGSFSKVLTPGIRLGYVVAPLPLVRRLELAKQAADLHTATLTQMVVHEVVKDGFLDQHIPTIRNLYANQCQVMLDAMAEQFPEGVTWTRPEGGMAQTGAGRDVKRIDGDGVEETCWRNAVA